MRIQASHMNLGFMQQLKARQEQGENLGYAEALLQDSAGDRLSNGLNVDVENSGLSPAMVAVEHAPDQNIQKHANEPPPQTLGATFANEVIRRMGEADGENGETKDNSDLRHSLGQAMDWMRERFGDEAAAAAAGMVLQSTASGVNEETLGDGLLNALKFVDRNFGFAAGDAAIAKFNDSVNPAINEYFENGANEVFFATPAQPLDGPSAKQDLTSRLFMRAVQEAPKDEDAKSLTEQLLGELKKELDKVAELQNLTSQLEAEFNPAQVSPQAALNSYATTPVPAGPQFADVRV